jgi:cation diffusion facilitator CzcD-associated flavoprotein CzcO
VAQETYLAARRGAHIVPKYIAGKPIDQPWRHGALAKAFAHPRVPWALRQRLLEKLLAEHVGRVEDYGLPKPDHRIGEAHPTVSGRILDRLAHGAITPKPNLAELRGDRVAFADGTEVEADVVVYCTGYKVTFPFFDEDFISAPDNDLPLFRRVFHPDYPDVFFLALLQPLGATMPIAEAQGRWLADYLRGHYALPAAGEMAADIRADQRAMQRRYVASKRHTIQVDFDDYLRDLEKERAAGAERARARGGALPVARRAKDVPRTADEAVAA